VRLADSNGGDSPALEEAFVTLTPGQRPLKTLVFVTSITDEFILGLDVLRTQDAAMVLKCLVL
jgi:hypothetical protein